MIDGAGFLACGCRPWVPTLRLWFLDMTAHLFSVRCFRQWLTKISLWAAVASGGSCCYYKGEGSMASVLRPVPFITCLCPVAAIMKVNSTR